MPGSFVAKTTRTFAIDDSTPINGSRIEVGTHDNGVNATFPAATVNAPFDMTFDVADIQSLVLVSSVDLTIKTNNAATPGNTIPLKAGSPLEWSKSDGYYACPFTVDVTDWFISCAAAARLRGYILTS